MVDLEAQGEKMKTELCRYFKNPLYWIVLATGLSVRAVLAYFDRMYRSKDFWALSADFWSKIGSVTVGFLIVLVLIGGAGLAVYYFKIFRPKKQLEQADDIEDFEIEETEESVSEDDDTEDR